MARLARGAPRWIAWVLALGVPLLKICLGIPLRQFWEALDHWPAGVSHWETLFVLMLSAIAYLAFLVGENWGRGYARRHDPLF